MHFFFLGLFEWLISMTNSSSHSDRDAQSPSCRLYSAVFFQPSSALLGCANAAGKKHTFAMERFNQWERSNQKTSKNYINLNCLFHIVVFRNKTTQTSDQSWKSEEEEAFCGLNLKGEACVHSLPSLHLPALPKLIHRIHRPGIDTD